MKPNSTALNGEPFDVPAVPEAAQSSRKSLMLTAVADREGIDRETLADLMVAHGYLELAYYGSQQRRLLFTDHPGCAEIGWSVGAGVRRHASGTIDHARSAPFAVFFEDRLQDVLWTLDLAGITATARAQGGKKPALAWLLATHDFLPDKELARISGYSLAGVKKARAKIRAAAESEVFQAPCRYELRDYALTLVRPAEAIAA
jgi:hypothetical protein